MAQVKGCHLVGSVPLSNTESVFKQCTAGLPHRLKRLPDGETGSRIAFTYFQSFIFQSSPDIMTQFVYNTPVDSRTDFTLQQLDEGIEKLKKAGPLETGYDEKAIESFHVFKKLRDEQVIPKATRFQVSVPTFANVLAPFVQKMFQPQVEPVYEEALFRAMRKIQDSIPHQDLAIQIDLAVDTAYWEGVEMFKPWFGDGNVEEVRSYIVDYVVRMIDQVDKDVEVGLHNCYGDMQHRHWLEPKSLRAVVDRALRVFDKSSHNINFFHCPVAKSAIDNLEEYFAPLRELVPMLKEHGTDLYLGLIHYDDMAATRKMMEAAQKVLDGKYEFGVATECGWGRTSPDEIEDIMKMSRDVSQPVV